MFAVRSVTTTRRAKAAKAKAVKPAPVATSRTRSVGVGVAHSTIKSRLVPVDNIPSGLLTSDMHGKVNLVNDTACSILGVTREDAEGKPMKQVLAGIEGWEARDPGIVPPF